MLWSGRLPGRQTPCSLATIFQFFILKHVYLNGFMVLANSFVLIDKYVVST